MARATGLTGAAGEYYVAAELSRRDWLATVTIKNSPRADVLAQRPDVGSIVAIQTKTSNGASFFLGEKDERPTSRDYEWYVMVALGQLLDRPSFYIVPRHVIAAFAYLEHREWMENRGLLHAKVKYVRNENKGRSIRVPWLAGYLEQWDLLDGSAFKAPYLGDPVFLDLADEIGLPADYRPLSRRRRRAPSRFNS